MSETGTENVKGQTDRIENQSKPNLEGPTTIQGPLKSARVDDSNGDLNRGPVKEMELGFQQILAERKAESKRLANEKRLEGLRLIQERNSLTDTDDVGVDPLEHFPKEVWCMVLEKVTPSDKSNLTKVNSLFRDLLDSNRIRDILFPLILDHKTGLIQKYFQDPLLELRRTSKSLRNAIDLCFEDELVKLIKPPGENPNKLFDYSWDVYRTPNQIRLEMAFDVEKLQNILEIQRPAKIFKRDLIVIGPTMDDDDTTIAVALGEDGALDEEICLRYFNLFVANVTKVLEEIGDQIWRFEFYCEGIQRFGISRRQAYTLLRMWLQLLPNLKLLDICFNALSFTYLPENFEAIDDFTLEEFPNLPELKRIDLYSSREEFDCLKLIADALIVANPQIKMINFDGPFNYRFMSMSQPSLLNLELCRLGNRTYPLLLKDIEYAIQQSKWNLKMLELYTFGKSASMNSLIQLLHNLPTLESVYLHVDTITFTSGSGSGLDYLRLPSLIHFGFEFRTMDEEREYDGGTHFFFSLQFLLHSPRIGSLVWRQSSLNGTLIGNLRERIRLFERSVEGDDGGMLDFAGGFNPDLNKSNLWNAFPKLEQIRLEYKFMERIETFRKYRGFLYSFA